MTPRNVRLDPFPPAEVPAWVRAQSEGYGADKVRSGAWSVQEAVGMGAPPSWPPTPQNPSCGFPAMGSPFATLQRQPSLASADRSEKDGAVQAENA